MTEKIMEYLKNTFNFDYNNSFTRHTLENIIDYAVNHLNHSKNQLAYFLYDIIDELEFEEIKNFIDNLEVEQ